MRKLLSADYPCLIEYYSTFSLLFVALPYLLKYLLDNHGLALTLQVESGLFASTIICALTFKPLIHHPCEEEIVEEKPPHG